jgi:hypothetical protein
MTTQERECVQDLIVALESMLEAHAALMPGLQHISVPDYALQNDAPIQARKAVTRVRKQLRSTR